MPQLLIGLQAQEGLTTPGHPLTGLRRRMHAGTFATAWVANSGAIPPDHGLTRREREVLALLVTGTSTTGIADALCISPRTATTHLQNIYRKVGVSSRAAATAWAARNGFL